MRWRAKAAPATSRSGSPASSRCAPTARWCWTRPTSRRVLFCSVSGAAVRLRQRAPGPAAPPRRGAGRARVGDRRRAARPRSPTTCCCRSATAMSRCSRISPRCRGQIHPEAFYRVAVSLAGELGDVHREPQAPGGVSALQARRPERDVPPGDRGAAPVALGGAVSRPRCRSRCRSASTASASGPITDRSLVTDATWVLAVKAQVPAETLRRGFPNQVKIGPVEQIRELINVALPGVAVRAAAGGAAPASLLRRRDVFRTRSQQPLLGGAGKIGRNRDPRHRRYSRTRNRVLGDQGIAADER